MCFGMCPKMLGLYAHLVCWLCDLHLQCVSHICLVPQPNVYTDTGNGHLVVILEERSADTDPIQDSRVILERQS